MKFEHFSESTREGAKTVNGTFAISPSIWSSYFIDLSPEQMVETFSRKGWFNSELSDEHASVLLARGNPEKIGAEFKDFSKNNGLYFPQGHLRLKCDITDVNRAEGVDILKRWFDLFDAVGIKNAVLHPGGYRMIEQGCEPERILEANIDAVRELAEYIKGTDLTICLENIVRTAPECDDLLNIINAVGCSNVGICLDTGHLNMCSRRQLDFIRKAGSYLKALHLADNQGSSDQHLMPYGRGTVPWDDVLEGLKEVKYEGLFNFEIPGENNCPLAIRLAKLDYLKELAAFMLEKTIWY